MYRRQILRAGSIALAGSTLWQLSACGTKPPKPPKPVELRGRFEATPDLNPSVSQRASPLLIRLYELKADAAFNRADFMALYQSDAVALGGDLVAREELMLQPGESRAFGRTLSLDTRFLAVFGAYRDIERSTWRAIAPVGAAGDKPRGLVIRAGARSVSLVLDAV